MSEGVEVIRFGAEHRRGVLALWARYFGAWSAGRLEQRWAWQFEANPWASERGWAIHVGVQGDRVVGHIAGVPIPMRVDGRRTIVLAATGLVADESQRWLGFRLVRALLGDGPVLATAMSEAARKLLVTCGARPIGGSRGRLVLARRSSGALARSIRWRLPAALCPLVSGRVLGGLGLGRTRDRGALPRAEEGADVRPIGRFDGSADGLWERASAGTGWTVERDAAYLNWRYVDMPTQRAVRLGLYEGGELSAVCVGVVRAKGDRTMRPCVRFGEVAEVVARDPGSAGVRGLVARVCGVLDRRGVDAITTSRMTGGAGSVLEGLGWKAEESDEFEGALCSAGAGAGAGTLGEGGGWMYGAGDGDSMWAFCL